MMEEPEEVESPFPGLNKSHGFFHLIERNQRDRESYHHQQEEMKEARKLEVKKGLRSERDAKRRPPKALYCPPQMRQHSRLTNTSQEKTSRGFAAASNFSHGLTATEQPQGKHGVTSLQHSTAGNSVGVSTPCKQFALEVEVEPESWWKGVVQCGQEARVVEAIHQQYCLTPQSRDALLDMMKEFVQTQV